MSVTGKQALINPARILYTLLNPKRAQEAVWMSFEQIRQEINRDRLWGAEAIAAVINLTPRQTWYLLEKHLLPAKKVGGRWTASRRALLTYLNGETSP